MWFGADRLPVQVTGIFRGGFTTLLRESIGNAVFFTTYEHVRYYMHLQLKDASSNHSNLIDVGVGIMSGGLGGIAGIVFFFFLYLFLFWIGNKNNIKNFYNLSYL